MGDIESSAIKAEKIINLADDCKKIYKNNNLSLDSKINILSEIKSIITKTQCYKNNVCACSFSYVCGSEYDEKENNMKIDIMCSFRKGMETSINGSDVTRETYSSDCLINLFEFYIDALLDNLSRRKCAPSKKGFKTKIFERINRRGKKL